ncbi:hypothetical protein BJF85_04720 [Saccharomonospora sp. CUA-673]|uniref:hypothetical protein n=1 Tax=Saccharomonospora sp. CUA-673 TaxID=1904969 RepID=UPI00095E3607|nr:hypothetical protein [Saccharomonospora sp. CUA-673]OLT41722.1 hypothetical protein BJF85_04720 [Saccharomonospora sp. CUA-673]
MSCFVLLITDLTSMRHEIEQYARGVRLVARPPHQLTGEDWNRAALVLIDAQAAPILRDRPQELPARDAVILLTDPEDQDEPDLYRHALTLGAAHLITVPDGSGALRTQMSMLAERPALVVAVLDPDPSGEVGTASTASLALAGTAAGEHLGLIDARPTRLSLHRALQRARYDAPVASSGSLRTLFVNEQQAPPHDAVRDAMTDLARRHAVTLAHLDPHQSDTVAVLGGVDLIIVPVRARSVTAQATRSVVTAACRATPHVHVHVIGDAAGTDVVEAVAAGIGAGYPSMTGVAPPDMPDESRHVDVQLADTSHHRRLWEVVARYRPRTSCPV